METAPVRRFGPDASRLPVMSGSVPYPSWTSHTASNASA